MKLNDIHKGNWVRDISVKNENTVEVTVESSSGAHVIYQVSTKPTFPDNNDPGETAHASYKK